MTIPVLPAARSSPPAPAESVCYHCGLPLGSAVFRVAVRGVEQPMCCPGCQAVAQTIVTNGLDAYYLHRTAPAPAQAAPDALLNDLRVYDLPEIQRNFVRSSGEPHEREASLLLDGITCAACVWLIERRLQQMPGISAVAVNYATRRARVRWNDATTRLSSILAAIAGLGYGAQPYDAARSDAAFARERRGLLKRLFVAGFGMMQVMMYAYPAYIDDGALTEDIGQLMRLASLVLTTPVALWSAMPFYTGAWRELRSGRLGMDVPVAIGIMGAFVASAYATWRGAGDVYFDSVAMFVFLLLGARYLELGARTKAAQAQERLVRQAPATAERFVSYPASDTTTQVAAAALDAGDRVLVRPGAVFPADGVVVEGAGAADESLLTGEVRAVPKCTGDAVIGGAVNLQGPLVVRVERVGEESVLASILRLMDRAQAEKPPLAAAADRVARVFVATLLLVTVIAVAAWLVIDPARAPWIAIAILVVTCPCALSLATPAALTAATGALYQSGILVTRGHALETLANATDFVFDKTGTLTFGRMGVIATAPLAALNETQCLSLAATLEARSEHPVARAFLRAAQPRDGALADCVNVPGQGMEGRVDGRVFRIGKPAYVAALHGCALPQDMERMPVDATVVALGDAHGWIALFALDDVLRPEAKAAVTRLRAAGKTLHILSGDSDARVRRLAAELGIAHACGDARPQDKLHYVRTLQQSGAVVAMTGDGVNDAPVLAQAQVSVALAGGTQLAQVNADIVLMSDRLTALCDALATARRLMRVVRQNLGWAVAYNAVALPLALAGLVTPLVAAAGMSLSSLTVVLNALRLLPRRAKADNQGEAGTLAVAAAAKKPSAC